MNNSINSKKNKNNNSTSEEINLRRNPTSFSKEINSNRNPNIFNKSNKNFKLKTINETKRYIYEKRKNLKIM